MYNLGGVRPVTSKSLSELIKSIEFLWVFHNDNIFIKCLIFDLLSNTPNVWLIWFAIVLRGVIEYYLIARQVFFA